MAFTNFMGIGTYTVIHSANFNKQDKSISMQINTYLSESKTQLLAENRIEVRVDKSGYPVKNLTTNTPPLDSEIRDAYVVASEPTNSWVGLENKVVAWNGMTWDTFEPSDLRRIYDQSGDCTFLWDVDQWIRISSELSDSEFDAFFSVTTQNQEDTNLLKQCYDYLKTRPEFTNAEDA